MVTLGILLGASGAGRSGAGLTGLVGASALAMGVTLMSSGIHEAPLLCPASVLGSASVLGPASVLGSASVGAVED